MASSFKFLIILLSLAYNFCIASTTSKSENKDALPADSIYNLDSQWKNQYGKSISLSNFRGKPVIISMVYMTCTYSCPLTIARMKEIEGLLTPENKGKTQFVLVTFDSLRDTPQAMLKYAKKNKLTFPQWTFLANNNESNVRELSALIDFKYKKLQSGEFEHSYAIIALDENGRIMGKTEGSAMVPKLISDLINSLK
jgi:protein SCO1/2